MRKNKNSAARAEETLCPNCGFCCDGTLFTQVSLRQGDSAKRLRQLGLRISRQGKTTSFCQPCPAFKGKWCGIYAERPVNCRKFECGILMRAKDGELDEREGLKEIRKAKRKVKRVNELLHKLGQDDETTALRERIIEVMQAPLDLGGDPETIKDRERLSKAVESMMEMLNRKFMVSSRKRESNQDV